MARRKHDKDDLGPWLFGSGVLMLVFAAVSVLVGVTFHDPRWFGIAVVIGGWGLIYVVVVGALS